MSASYPTTVEVPSGRYVDMVDPDPASITLIDVAHKLAQVNRWGGSARWPYSVAQHGVFVSHRLEQLGTRRELWLMGLHHDSAEAFLGDVPRPWKKQLGPVYEMMTELFDWRIAEALDLPLPDDDDRALIKQADNFAMMVEARHLMPSEGRKWQTVKAGKTPGVPARVVTPIYWRAEIDWQTAKDEFITRHEELVHA